MFFFDKVYAAGVLAGVGLGLVIGEGLNAGSLFRGPYPEATLIGFVLIAIGATLGQRWSAADSDSAS